MKRRLALLLGFLASIVLILIWRLFGWRLDGDMTDEDKLIALGAPHTSN